MSTYPKSNIDPEFSEIKTIDDEIKDIGGRSEKHDHEKFLKSFKIGNEYYKKKCESLNKRNFFN